MILQEIFTWFDLSIVKQSNLIYANRAFSIMADFSYKNNTEQIL